MCVLEKSDNCKECKFLNTPCIDRIIGEKGPKFECDTCPDMGTCEYAFDPYCTPGDCLAVK